jgi:hypothetical protein
MWEKKCSKNTNEESLLEITGNKDDIDKDKSSLLSMVPSFKKLSGEQKFISSWILKCYEACLTFSQLQYPISNPHF